MIYYMCRWRNFDFCSIRFLQRFVLFVKPISSPAEHKYQQNIYRDLTKTPLIYIYFLKSWQPVALSTTVTSGDLCSVDKLSSCEGNCQVAGLVIDQNNNNRHASKRIADKSTELIIASTQTITICPFICEISLCPRLRLLSSPYKSQLCLSSPQ